jgi:fructose-specific component phosphotransferase system IIB-like protein
LQARASDRIDNNQLRDKVAGLETELVGMKESLTLATLQLQGKDIMLGGRQQRLDKKDALLAEAKAKLTEQDRVISQLQAQLASLG